MIDLVRGTTVRFSTTFYSYAREIVQPSGALVNLTYLVNGAQASAQVEMSAPSGDTSTWTALWDTREIDACLVSWSIHTEGLVVPFGVEDGEFNLVANPANLSTF